MTRASNALDAASASPCLRSSAARRCDSRADTAGVVLTAGGRALPDVPVPSPSVGRPSSGVIVTTPTSSRPVSCGRGTGGGDARSGVSVARHRRSHAARRTPALARSTGVPRFRLWAHL